MLIARSVADLRQALAPYRRPAFVPTMGNLHEGHIALVRQAQPLGDVTVASIFVNRLQFLPHEDFDSYPRTWEADCAKLQAAGCDVLFAPREADLYPEPQTFKVHPDPVLADMLGMNLGKMPKFVHNFMQDAGSVRGAMEAYVQAVKQGRFPDNAVHAW